VARAMKNNGIRRLVLVNPASGYENEARILAHGSLEILENATTVSSLQEALEGVQLVVGASAKTGRARKKPFLPKKLAEWLHEQDPLPRTAILFGREDGGLTHPELQVCRELVRIPMAGAYPSINLSHAVMIVLYEIYSAFALDPRPMSQSTSSHADTAEIERMLVRMKEALHAIGFDRNGSDGRMLRSVRHILDRRSLESREIRTAHKIMDYLCKRLDLKGSAQAGGKMD